MVTIPPMGTTSTTVTIPAPAEVRAEFDQMKERVEELEGHLTDLMIWKEQATTELKNILACATCNKCGASFSYITSMASCPYGGGSPSCPLGYIARTAIRQVI